MAGGAACRRASSDVVGSRRESRLSTRLTDGTLVETARLWTRRPPWPRSLRSGWAGMDVREEMERSSVPTRGRSVRAVAVDDVSTPAGVATLVEAHRAHVAEQSSAPVPVSSLEDAIALRRRAFEHDLQVRRRVLRIVFALGLAAAVVVGGLSGATPGVRHASWLVVAGEAIVVVALLTWAQGRLVRRVSYVRRIRPGFR